MKYAFIIGSNCFVVPNPVVSFAADDEEKPFLKINAIYHDLPSKKEESFLDVDVDVSDTNGTPIFLMANMMLKSAPYTIEKERDSVKVLRPDGTTVIQIHQIDDHTAMSLEHNIIAELEVNTPIAAIRISGEFALGALHIKAEDERLFINGNGYANMVQAGERQLKFTQKGVELR